MEKREGLEKDYWAERDPIAGTTFVFNGGKNKCWLPDKSRWLGC